MNYETVLTSWAANPALSLTHRVLATYALDPSLTAEQVASKLDTTGKVVITLRSRLVKAGLLIREHHGWRSWTYTAA